VAFALDVAVRGSRCGLRWVGGGHVALLRAPIDR
jgi:hypothetical protein